MFFSLSNTPRAHPVAETKKFATQVHTPTIRFNAKAVATEQQAKQSAIKAMLLCTPSVRPSWSTHNERNRHRVYFTPESEFAPLSVYRVARCETVAWVARGCEFTKTTCTSWRVASSSDRIWTTEQPLLRSLFHPCWGLCSKTVLCWKVGLVTRILISTVPCLCLKIFSEEELIAGRKFSHDNNGTWKCTHAVGLCMDVCECVRVVC